MDVEYIANLIGSSIGILLLILTYTYIDKLERIGCDCAKHPNREFVKNYCMFAIGFLLLTMFFPPVKANEVFGNTVGIIYMVLNIVFVLVTIVFFVKSLTYVRYLMKEKCKCSEDIRREVLYIWSIAEIIILVALVVIPLVIAIGGGALAFVRTSTNEIKGQKEVVMNAVVNPVKSLRKVPESLKKSLRMRK